MDRWSGSGAAPRGRPTLDPGQLQVGGRTMLPPVRAPMSAEKRLSRPGGTPAPDPGTVPLRPECPPRAGELPESAPVGLALFCLRQRYSGDEHPRPPPGRPHPRRCQWQDPRCLPHFTAPRAWPPYQVSRRAHSGSSDPGCNWPCCHTSSQFVHGRGLAWNTVDKLTPVAHHAQCPGSPRSHKAAPRGQG